MKPRTGWLAGVRSQLSYANVVATIALFAALAGGYAAAFSGSGSLTRASIATPTVDGEKKLLKLQGVGQLRVGCGGSGILTAYLKNKSGRTLQMSAIRSNDAGQLDWGRVVVPDGAKEAIGVAGPTANNTANWFSIAPAGGSARPQAIAVVNAERGCETSHVQAMAISTG